MTAIITATTDKFRLPINAVIPDSHRGNTGEMPVLVRRLFGIGKLPADVRAAVEAEGLIHLADFVPVTRRFSGAIPGLRSAHSVASYVGSVAFTSQRVLATLSSLPKLAGPTVDVRWDATQSGVATAEISSSGLQVEAEVDDLDETFSGHLSLQYKLDIPTRCWPNCPDVH